LLAIAPQPLNVRAAHIRSDKPADEHAVRLERMRPVVNVEAIPLPVQKAGAACAEACAAFLKACAAYEKTRAVTDKAYAAYIKTCAAYYKGRIAYVKTCSDHRAKIEALHTLECPGCPWDGKTLFPKKVRKRRRAVRTRKP
jgi:hypothetical protein